MKKKLLKNENLLSTLSLLAFCVFAILAISSGNFIVDDLLDGEITVEEVFANNLAGLTTDGRYYQKIGTIYSTRETVGYQDKNGEWHGKIERVYNYDKWVKDENGNPKNIKKYFNVEVNMVHGEKHGVETVTYDSGNVKQYCYWYGKMVDCNKLAKNGTVEETAFNILINEQAEAHAFFNLYEFDDNYLQDFFYAVETDIAQYEFEFDEFDDYYSDAIVEMEETAYDSLLVYNQDFTTFKRLNMLKNNVFRLASLERSRDAKKSTFTILKNTYPAYVDMILTYNDILEEEITEVGFSAFCSDYDSRFDALSPLDVTDPFFTDSINNRMFSILLEMFKEAQESSENKSAKIKWAVSNYNKRLSVDNVESYLKSASGEGVYVELVFALMVYDVIDSDVIEWCIKQAYIRRNNVVVEPTLATKSESGDGNNKASLSGYIFEDGGSEITARGITWAETYDPDIEDNKIESGDGIGEFSVEITGLDKNETYYARAYAVTDVGTTYGNCVEFTTDILSSTFVTEQGNFEFNIYPNPVVSTAIVRFSRNSIEDYTLYISNVNGQIVKQKELAKGANIVEMNLSNLPNGFYSCTLTNGQSKTSKKIVVAH